MADEVFVEELSGIIAAKARESPLVDRYAEVLPMRTSRGELDRGAFSVMFTALDQLHQRRVVLKFLHPSIQGVRHDYFIREIEICKRLIGQRHVIQLTGDRETLPLEVTTPYGTLTLQLQFFALERAEGNLEAFLFGRRRPRSLVRRLEILRDVVLGIARLHRIGYCHRDLKPDNVLIFLGGGAKVADFGTCRLVSGQDRLAPDYHLPAGHMQYAAPEMFAAGGYRSELYVGADWFGVGAIMFEALTGQNVYVSIGLRSPDEIRRTLAAVSDLADFRRHMRDASSRYPVPSLAEFDLPWLAMASSRTLSVTTGLLQSLCDIDFERRLQDPKAILRRLDMCLALARYDANRAQRRTIFQPQQPTVFPT